MNLTTVQKVNENYANYYDLIFSRVPEDGRRNAIIRMGLKPYERIIETGAGSNLSFKHYNNSQLAFSFTCIDISLKMLQKARK